MPRRRLPPPPPSSSAPQTAPIDSRRRPSNHRNCFRRTPSPPFRRQSPPFCLSITSIDVFPMRLERIKKKTNLKKRCGNAVYVCISYTRLCRIKIGQLMSLREQKKRFRHRSQLPSPSERTLGQLANRDLATSLLLFGAGASLAPPSVAVLKRTNSPKPRRSAASVACERCPESDASTPPTASFFLRFFFHFSTKGKKTHRRHPRTAFRLPCATLRQFCVVVKKKKKIECWWWWW